MCDSCIMYIFCVYVCLWACSSRKRGNTCCKDLYLIKVTITTESPVTPPVLLRDPLFSPTPAPAPHCPPPCPHCLRRRKTPPRSWTVLQALLVQWVNMLSLSVFGNSMWVNKNCHWIIHLALVRKLYQCCYWRLSSNKGSFSDLLLSVEAFY